MPSGTACIVLEGHMEKGWGLDSASAALTDSISIVLIKASPKAASSVEDLVDLGSEAWSLRESQLLGLWQ